MLSLFPTLLAYGQLAPFLLRLTLGAVIIHWAWNRVKSSNTKIKSLAILEGIVGLLLIVGLYTQLAALASAIIFAVKLGKKLQTKSLFTDGVNYYFLLFILSVSIVLLGAGAFSFDLPL